jgi:hypothetical protein
VMDCDLKLQVLSSFNAGPIEPAMIAALSASGAKAEIGYTGREGMSRYMVSPGSEAELISGTIVLVRVEDWLRDGLLSGKSGDAWAREELKAKVKEFAAESALLAHRGKPVWFLGCPSTGWVAENYKLASLFRTYTNLLSARIGNVPQITTLTWPAALSANFEDRAGDHANNNPFTKDAFEILGKAVGGEVGRMLAAQSGPASASAGGSPELAAYLAGLQVRITVSTAQPDDQPHVDHIIRSAASFSLTGEQPNISDSKVNAVVASERCLLISVSDRLADHGPSGAILYHESENELVVDWISLTCPILGKQVEFALVPELAQMAKDRGLGRLVFEYRPSARNQPIHAFLQSVANRESETRFVLAVDEAERRINAKGVSPGAWQLSVRTEKTAHTGR